MKLVYPMAHPCFFQPAQPTYQTTSQVLHLAASTCLQQQLGTTPAQFRRVSGWQADEVDHNGGDQVEKLHRDMTEKRWKSDLMRYITHGKWGGHEIVMTHLDTFGTVWNILEHYGYCGNMKILWNILDAWSANGSQVGFRFTTVFQSGGHWSCVDMVSSILPSPDDL